MIDAIAHLRHHRDLQSELYLSPNQINDHCQAKVEPVVTQSLGLKDVETLYSTYSHLCSTQFTSTHPHQETSLNPSPTMETEEDWADVAKSLAQSLHLDSPTQLRDWFEQLQSDSTTHTHTQDKSTNIKQMFYEQQQSLSHLTDAVSTLVVTLKGEHQPTTTDNPSTIQLPTTTHQTNNSGEQKVNRAIDTIMDYNNNQATKTKDKWRITISALKQLTKCNQGLIARVIDARQTEIEQHHQLHQLVQYHNSKGKSAPKITEILTLI